METQLSYLLFFIFFLSFFSFLSRTVPNPPPRLGSQGASNCVAPFLRQSQATKNEMEWIETSGPQHREVLQGEWQQCISSELIVLLI